MYTSIFKGRSRRQQQQRSKRTKFNLLCEQLEGRQLLATGPLITVNPVNITYGTALVNTQLSGTAVESGTTVPGTFAYDPSVKGAVLHASAAPQLELVIFTPTNDPSNTV